MELTHLELNNFLKSLSLDSQYEILEEGKDNEELVKVAKKAGIIWPSPDLAIFKCKYAFTDFANKNGCTLPTEEVEKAIDTIRHKAIDLDHLRKKVVGHLLYGEVEGNTIIAYGCFYKDNFKEDYAVVKELMNQGNLKVSFEAFGKRQHTSSTKYNLKDIIFSGMGLLIDTEPAFSNASVLELAKERVLELAKVMKAPESFITEEKGTNNMEEKIKKYLETADFNVYDMETMMRLLGMTACPSCDEEYTQNPLVIDFQNGTMDTKCRACESINKVYMTPKAKVTEKAPMKTMASEIIEVSGSLLESYQGKEEKLDDILIGFFEESKKLSTETRNALSDDDFAVVKEVKNKVTGKTRKIRMFPIHDATHVRNALSRMAQMKVQDNLKKMGMDIDEVKKKIEKKAKELKIDFNKSSIVLEESNKMEEKIKELEQEIAKFVEQVKVKDAELANLKSQVEEANKKITEVTANVETAKSEVEKAKADTEQAVKVAREQATLVANRRAELGTEFSKDIKDEEILDDVKFENAKLKKEVATLKAGKAGETVTETASLTTGTKKKIEDEEVVARNKRIREFAFGA